MSDDKRPTPWVTPGEDYEASPISPEDERDLWMGRYTSMTAQYERLHRALQVSQEHNIEQGRRIEALQDERDALRERLERQALRGTDDE